MLIKYFNQRGNIIDKSINNIIKPESKIEILDRQVVLNFLKADGINVNEIQTIRYYDEKNEGWRLFEETTRINSDQINFHLQLIIKFSDSYFSIERGLIKNFQELYQRITNQEKKFEEIESIVRSTNKYSLGEKENFNKNSKSHKNININFKPQINFSKSISGNENRLDLGYIFTNPLFDLDLENDTRIYLEEYLDYQKEIENIIEAVKSTNKKFTATIEVGTVSNLIKVIEMNPKSLLISCEVSVEEIEGKKELFIHLEDKDGCIERVNTENFKNLIKEGKEIQLICISTYHTGIITDILKTFNIPAIITVHNNRHELDQSVPKFTRYLYESLIFGRTIKSSFNRAINIIKNEYGNNALLKRCCCFHSHKPYCLFYKKFVIHRDEAHLMHIKVCKCKEDIDHHVHNSNCAWAKKFLTRMNISEVQYGDKIKVCCCSPEIAHHKPLEKFKLIIDSKYDHLVLFPSLYNGSMEILNENICINLKFSSDLKIPLMGRNKQMTEIIYLLKDNHSRLLTIYGDVGIGKEAVIKCLAVYMFERNYFEAGVHFIQSNSSIFSECEIINLTCSSLNLNINFDDVNELFKFIDSDILLIFKFHQKENDGNVFNHKTFFEKIIKSTRHLKFIVISPIYSNSQYEQKILVTRLSNYELAKMLNSLASDFLATNLRNNIEIIEKDELIKITEGIPKGIIDIAGFLHDSLSKNEIIEIFKRINPKKISPLCQEKVLKKIKDLINEEEPNDRKKIYGLLYYLWLSPNGILQRDLIKLYSNKQTLTYILSIINRFTQMNLLINQKEIKELSTYVYFLEKNDLNLIENFMEENISDDEIFVLYQNLIHYYSITCRRIVTNLNQDAGIDFSALQNYGMWLSLNIQDELSEEVQIILSKYTHEKIYNPVKYYLYIEENIKTLIKSEILERYFFPYFTTQLPIETKEIIEQLSICIPSILKAIGKLTDCMTMIKNFIEITEKFELKLARGRLMIFSMSLYPVLTNPITIIYGSSSNEFSFNSQFIQILKMFNGSNFYEGIAESYFCRAVTTYEIEKLKTNNSIRKELLKEIIEDLQITLVIYESSNKFYSEDELKLSNKNSLGYARVCFVLSDYIVNGGNSDDIYLNLLDAARFIFEKKNKIIPYLKCMLISAKWHINKKNYSDAFKLAEKVASLGKTYYRTIIEDEATQILSTIKDLIQLQSQNLFVFIEAHQLVFGINFINSRRTENETSLRYSISYNSHQEIGYVQEDAVEPLVSYPNLFRKKLLHSSANIKQESVFKFDVMSKHNLTEVLHKGGRFLHLSSDFFSYKSNNSLFVEGNYGESVEITLKSLEKILNHSNCLFEIVLISIPQSRKLGEILVRLGVRHVICFDFSEMTNGVLNKFSYLPIKKLFEDFSISFLVNILMHETIEDAFNKSKNDFINQFKSLFIDSSCADGSLPDDDISPILLPTSSGHQILFSCENKNSEEKFRGDINLLNRTDRRENLQALIGRKKEIYFSIKILLGNNNLNIYGDSGIGRTTLVKEISNYLGDRQKFMDGLFYLDLNEIDTVESLKEMLNSKQINSIIEKNKLSSHCHCEDKKMLLIFDNCDKIIKRNESQFFILIFTLGFDRNNSIIFLLVSNKKLINPNFLHSEYLRLDPLNKLESTLLFLTTCERKLDKEEIDAECEDEVELIEHLCESKRINACKGYPAYIIKLSKLALNSKLNRIDHKQFLPNKFYKKLTDYELDDNYRFQQVINKKYSNASYKLSKQSQRKSLNENNRNEPSKRKISNIDSVDEIKHDYKLNRKNNYMKKVNRRRGKAAKINKFNNSRGSSNDEEYDCLRNGFDVDDSSNSREAGSRSSEICIGSSSRVNEYPILNHIDSANNNDNPLNKKFVDIQDSINYQLANTFIKSKINKRNPGEKNKETYINLRKNYKDCFADCNREKINHICHNCDKLGKIIGAFRHSPDINHSFTKSEQNQSERYCWRKNSDKNSQASFRFNANNFVFDNFNQSESAEIKKKNSKTSIIERLGIDIECGVSSKIFSQ